MSLADREMNAVSECMFLHGGGYVSGTGYVIEVQGPRLSYERCEVLNEEAGVSEDWAACRYPSTGLESLKFILVTSTQIFREVGSEKVLEENPAVVAEILRQRAEDRETLVARKSLADDLTGVWGGSSKVFQLFRAAIWFNGGDPGEGWEREDGAFFWQVGRNASHDFHMGLRKVGEEVTFFRGTYEPEWEDATGKSRGGWEQREVSEFRGYFGHA